MPCRAVHLSSETPDAAMPLSMEHETSGRGPSLEACSPRPQRRPYIGGMLRFPDRRLEEHFNTWRSQQWADLASASHLVSGFLWSWSPFKLLLVSFRGGGWSPAVLVASVIAQILNVVANGFTAWDISTQGKKSGRPSEFARVVTLYLGIFTTMLVRTLIGNSAFVAIFALPGTFTGAALHSAVAVINHMRLSSALPFFLVNFASGVPFELPPGATPLGTASHLATFFALAVVLPSVMVAVVEASERREFLAPMGDARRVQAMLSPFWVRVADWMGPARRRAAAALLRLPALLTAQLFEGTSRAVRFLQYPDARLESMFNTWKLQQHQSLSSASHAMAGVCWTCGSLKFAASTLRDGQWNTAVLASIYLLEAANVCFNFFVSWDITREGRRTEKTRSERHRMLCILAGTLTNAAALAAIGPADFQAIFGFPGTFTTATLHSFAVMIDQVRLSSALPLFLLSFASVAPFEVAPGAAPWATAHRLLLFFFLAVIIPSVVAILLEARERHLFVEFHEDAKIRRLLSPFWRRVIYGVDSVYYAMDSMTPESDY